MHTSLSTKCAWCEDPLPEPGHDSIFIARDRADRELPICTSCSVKFKPVIVRLDKT